MNEIKQDSAAGDSVIPHLSTGARLRAAREAHGLTTQEIADRIKFSVRQVEALEADDAEHLPQGTFLRGFIRSYARVVHLDPAPLLNETATETEHHFDVTDVQGGGAPLPKGGAAERKNLYVLAGALIIAIGLAWFLFTQRDGGVQMIGVDSGMQSAVVIATATSSVTAVSSEVAASETVVPDRATPPVSVKAEAARTLPKNETIPAVAVAAEIPAKREIPLEQLMKRPIHFVFTEDAWVEVTDVNGEVLISRVTQAGGEKWIGGNRRAPYQVNIGKVGAIRLYYKGKEVDLSGFRPDGIAHLVLE
ncbi:RodZ domain-containing protein [Ferrigenium sp. UT5]|uniref:RodZ domain-containing protein n=1 Tax=Ferrigenium sp. UT5 TaxID=3242105 RepID=UPI00354C9368